MYLSGILKKIRSWRSLILFFIISVTAAIIENRNKEDDYQLIIDYPVITRGIITSRHTMNYSSKTSYKFTVDSTVYYSTSTGKIEGKRVGDSVWVMYSEISPKKNILHPSEYQ